jgi:hypothetical protein
MKSAVVGIMGLGFLLLLLSGLWTTLFPPTSRWTQEKADQSAKIKNRIYNLAFTVNAPNPSMHSGQDIGPLKAEYEQLKKEDAELNADFASATETPKTVSNFLKWSGISLAVIGIFGWYAVGQVR